MKKIVPEDAHLIPPEAERVFKGEIFDVYQWPQTMFDGSTATFEMLRRVDTVSVISIKDDKIIVLKQTQPTTPKPFLGFPGGQAERGEAPLEAAKREVLEETGMTFKKWKLLDVIQPVQKIEWFIYTFLATEFESQSDTNHDAGEKIEMFSLSFDEAVKDSNGQQRIDGNSLAGYGSLPGLINAAEFQGKEIEISTENT
jgi:ADP-ribose pyrophosphatase